jgi:hypothetical protein
MKRGRLSTVEIGGRSFLSRREVDSFERLPPKGWPKGKARKATKQPAQRARKGAA